MNYSTSSFPYENRWKMSSSISQMVPGVSSWAGTSPRSHSGSSSAGTLHHQGLALKLAHRNPNEGILRKALWGGDTWSQFRCSGDSASGVQGVDARRLCSVSLTKCTHQTNTFQAGARRMALAYFLTAQGEGRQLNGCHGSFSHHLEMCRVEKKLSLLTTHTEDLQTWLYLFWIFIAGIDLSPFERRASCMMRRENTTNGCFKNVAIYFCETDWN